MFTPTTLFNIAIEAEYAFQTATTGDERYRAYSLRDQAMACAEWLEKQTVKEMSHVGPFGDMPFKKGQKVRVKKGAIIHSMHPQRKKPYAARTTYTVELHYTSEGYIHTHRSVTDVFDPKVEWAGTGGYWCWTHPNNVELVED